MACSIGKLFPLFSPEGEKYWVPDWDYVNLMGTTELSEDYVFLTKTHDHGQTDAVWIVKKYDPELYCVEYYKIEPGQKIGNIKVNCFELDTNSTKIQVSYKYIALSSSGEEFISKFTKVGYGRFIYEWEKLLGKYLGCEK